MLLLDLEYYFAAIKEALNVKADSAPPLRPSFNASITKGDISLLFPAYNAFLNKLQTVPVVYVPTLGPPQPGEESHRYLLQISGSRFIHPSPSPSPVYLQVLTPPPRAVPLRS